MKKQSLNYFIYLFIIFLLSGSASAEWKTYEGVYFRGFENSTFKECGKSGEPWWLDKTPEASAQFSNLLDGIDFGEDPAGNVDELSRLPENSWMIGDAFFVSVDGFLHPSGEYGHLGQWSRQLTVRQFYSLRIATDSDLAKCE